MGQREKRRGAALLYESPFTDIAPKGPDGIFTSAQLEELLDVLDRVRASAQAASNKARCSCGGRSAA